jgi:hypothetical protein
MIWWSLSLTNWQYKQAALVALGDEETIDKITKITLNIIRHIRDMKTARTLYNRFHSSSKIMLSLKKNNLIASIRDGYIGEVFWYSCDKTISGVSDDSIRPYEGGFGRSLRRLMNSCERDESIFEPLFPFIEKYRRNVLDWSAEWSDNPTENTVVFLRYEDYKEVLKISWTAFLESNCNHKRSLSFISDAFEHDEFINYVFSTCDRVKTTRSSFVLIDLFHHRRYRKYWGLLEPHLPMTMNGTILLHEEGFNIKDEKTVSLCKRILYREDRLEETLKCLSNVFWSPANEDLLANLPFFKEFPATIFHGRKSTYPFFLYYAQSHGFVPENNFIIRTLAVGCLNGVLDPYVGRIIGEKIISFSSYESIPMNHWKDEQNSIAPFIRSLPKTAFKNYDDWSFVRRTDILSWKILRETLGAPTISFLEMNPNLLDVFSSEEYRELLPMVNPLKNSLRFLCKIATKTNERFTTICSPYLYRILEESRDNEMVALAFSIIDDNINWSRIISISCNKCFGVPSLFIKVVPHFLKIGLAKSDQFSRFLTLYPIILRRNEAKLNTMTKPEVEHYHQAISILNRDIITS